MRVRRRSARSLLRADVSRTTPMTSVERSQITRSAHRWPTRVSHSAYEWRRGTLMKRASGTCANIMHSGSALISTSCAPRSPAVNSRVTSGGHAITVSMSSPRLRLPPSGSATATLRLRCTSSTTTAPSSSTPMRANSSKDKDMQFYQLPDSYQRNCTAWVA